MSLNFNVFGGTSGNQKKTVNDVFTAFTKDLKEIQDKQAAEASRLEAEIQAKTLELSAAQKEQSLATSAIYNINKLFNQE
jgi:hypothetical protein